MPSPFGHVAGSSAVGGCLLYPRKRTLIAEVAYPLRAIDSEVVPTKRKRNVLSSHVRSKNLSVPIRHSALLFSLKIHINLIRTRLAARLAEQRYPTAKVA